MISVISMSCTDARMVVVRSMTTSSLMAGGIEACSCGSSASTLVDGLNNVRAGLAENHDHQHARLAIRPGR